MSGDVTSTIQHIGGVHLRCTVVSALGDESSSSVMCAKPTKETARRTAVPRPCAYVERLCVSLIAEKPYTLSVSDCFVDVSNHDVAHGNTSCHGRRTINMKNPT